MNPTLFISHGAPNLILSNLKSKKRFEDIGRNLKKPKYIIIFSAHYLTKNLKIINPTSNKLMYDFYGFEDELYRFKYDIKSDKELTLNLINNLRNSDIDIDIDEGRVSFDHGVWSILALMFKKLDVPVLQLSIPLSYSQSNLINLGEKLQMFKDEALIICSGSLTHNLADASFDSLEKSYAKNFNEKVVNIIKNGNKEDFINISKDINFYKNHPTTEHFLPLYIAFGNAINKCGESFNSEMLFSNISMESFIFDFEDIK